MIDHFLRRRLIYSTVVPLGIIVLWRALLILDINMSSQDMLLEFHGIFIP